MLEYPPPGNCGCSQRQLRRPRHRPHPPPPPWTPPSTPPVRTMQSPLPPPLPPPAPPPTPRSPPLIAPPWSPLQENPFLLHRPMWGAFQCHRWAKTQQLRQNVHGWRLFQNLSTSILTYGTYLPVPCPCHNIVTTFQRITIGSVISHNISLVIPPHHLLWNKYDSVSVLFNDTSQKLLN